MIIFDRGDSAQTRRSIAGAQTFTFPPMLPPGLAEACRMVRFRRSENPKKHRIHVARGAFRYPTRFRPHAGSGNAELPATGHVEHPLHSLTEQDGPERQGTALRMAVCFLDASRAKGHRCNRKNRTGREERDGKETRRMDEEARSAFSFSADLLDGRTMRLEELRGRVLLMVNTASRCGFTPQYAGLEALYREYRDRGLTVLGFPSNQFGRQEPGTADEIGVFCEKNYGVSFPMFAKIEVNGRGAHPLYRFLKKQKPGRFGFLTGGRISWNFTKFLIDREGRVAARYSPATRPETLRPAIEKLIENETGDHWFQTDRL